MPDKFQPEESSLIKPGDPAQPPAGVPQIGTVSDPSKVEGIEYSAIFHIGMTTKAFDFKVTTDHSAVMAALFLAIRKYPLVHTVTILEKETQRIVCYAPLLGIEKTIGPHLLAVGEGPAIATSSLPAGKTFNEIKQDIKFREGGARR